MREGKKKKEAPLVQLQQTKWNEEEGEDIGFLIYMSELWAPMALILQGFETLVCGSRMKSTKKRKIIIKKSHF